MKPVVATPEVVMRQRLLPILAVCFVLAACGQPDHSANAPATAASAAAPTAPPVTPDVPQAHTKRFHSVRMGFSIDYPAGMASSVRFDDTYQQTNDRWEAYATEDGSGTQLFMLTLPGSNEVSAAELRIGASSQAEQIRQCDQPPDAARPDSLGKADINGITFVTWKARDAAMSHYLDVHSYRVVHGGYCFAIDLLLARTNPEVYDPPKTPPFTSEEAFARLHKALQGFHFTR